MEHKTNSESVGEELVVVNQQVEKRDRFLPISIIVASVLIGGAIVFSSLYHGGALFGGGGGAVAGAAGAQGAAGGTQPNAAAAAAVMQVGSRDAVLGSANAKVTLVEYGDYQCPFCTRFFSQTEPQIIQNYVNTGKVRFVFRSFDFLGPESTAAANAAQCAQDQGKQWDYHQALYAAKVADENAGGGENDGFYNRAEFLKLANQVGLNIGTFTSCIDGNQHASDVAQAKAAATAAGVNSTPMFFVNGQTLLGAQPYSQFQTTIDTALKA